MITDTEIRLKGLEALINALGEVQAERFISLVLREPFDYTVWQRKLWQDKSVEQISSLAMEFRKKSKQS
ncbi:hypothetical protein BH10ACI1_BH10ACI1_21940 [soil metagenome]